MIRESPGGQKSDKLSVNEAPDGGKNTKLTADVHKSHNKAKTQPRLPGTCAVLMSGGKMARSVGDAEFHRKTETTANNGFKWGESKVGLLRGFCFFGSADGRGEKRQSGV